MAGSAPCAVGPPLRLPGRRGGGIGGGLEIEGEPREPANLTIDRISQEVSAAPSLGRRALGWKERTRTPGAWSEVPEAVDLRRARECGGWGAARARRAALLRVPVSRVPAPRVPDARGGQQPMYGPTSGSSLIPSPGTRSSLTSCKRVPIRVR